jgi:hypothetical protein
LVLTIGDFAALAGLVLVAMGVMFGLVRIMAAQLQTAIVACHARVDRVEQRVAALDADKVGKSDWIRVVVSHTSRNFAMQRHISELNGKIDTLLSVRGVPRGEQPADDETRYPHDYRRLREEDAPK